MWFRGLDVRNYFGWVFLLLRIIQEANFFLSPVSQILLLGWPHSTSFSRIGNHHTIPGGPEHSQPTFLWISSPYHCIWWPEWWSPPPQSGWWASGGPRRPRAWWAPSGCRWSIPPSGYSRSPWFPAPTSAAGQPGIQRIQISEVLGAEWSWAPFKIAKELEIQGMIHLDYPTEENFCNKHRQKLGIFLPGVQWPLDVFWGRKSAEFPQFLRIWDAHQAGIPAKDQVGLWWHRNTQELPWHFKNLPEVSISLKSCFLHFKPTWHKPK